METTTNDVRRQIINKAQGLFAHYGFQKTTMDDIAQASHRGKSTLYHYFQNKEEIFQVVIEKEADELKTEIEKAISQSSSPQEQLRAYIVTRMQAFKRLANLYYALQEDYWAIYIFLQEIRKDYDEYERKMITKILRAGVERGDFAIEDVELMAYVTVIATKGLEYPWIIEDDTEKIVKNIDTLLHTLFYGLLKR